MTAATTVLRNEAQGLSVVICAEPHGGPAVRSFINVHDYPPASGGAAAPAAAAPGGPLTEDNILWTFGPFEGLGPAFWAQATLHDVERLLLAS
jgi:hypothetical protein